MLVHQSALRQNGRQGTFRQPLSKRHLDMQLVTIRTVSCRCSSGGRRAGLRISRNGYLGTFPFNVGSYPIVEVASTP